MPVGKYSQRCTINTVSYMHFCVTFISAWWFVWRFCYIMNAVLFPTHLMCTRHSISERLRTYLWFQPGSVKFILFCKYSCIPLSSKLKLLIYWFPPQPLIRIHTERTTTKPPSLSDQKRSAATLRTRSSGSKLAAYRYHTESVYNKVCTKKSGTIRKKLF